MAFELDIVKTTTADNTQSTFSMYMTIGAIEDTPGNMTLNKVKYKALLIDLNFDKKIYQPCKMVAKLQITREDGTTPSQDDLSYYLFNLATLQTTFMKAAVALYQLEKNDNGVTIRTEVLKNHVVYDVTPHYTSTSLYVDLTIYSPDYALTTDIKSQTFVAKQLGKEILKGLFTNSNSYVKNKLRYAAESDEYIHPYLVQYNESFFDLLTRTANRWGEFVYYEDGELIVGRKPFKDPDDQNKDDIKVIESYSSLSFENWSADPTLLANSKKTVTTDRYLETIEKDEFIEHAADMKKMDATFWHKTFQRLFSMKGNIYDWLVNWLVDEGVNTGKNTIYLDSRKKEYNNHFFANTSDTKHYDTSGKKYCQFAYYDGEKGTRGLTQNAYADVLSKELTVGKEVLVMNMGTAYPKLRLGDVFTFSGASDPKPKYLVIGVECRDSTKITESYIDTSNSEEQKRVKVDVWAAHYYIHAIKQSNTPSATIAAEFYPPMLKTGHIRFSGPQRATIADTLDPMLNGRYRVRSTWQGSSDAGSPWLKVAREVIGEQSGAVWELEEGANVLLDFEDGNVELPYIVGVLQNDEKRANNRASMLNVMDLTTPAGHAIRLNDGYGGGATTFIASLMPALGWFKGFFPEWDAFSSKDSKPYEGGVEITDKFGIYSIKASTDQRNISIKSPYGDVQLNAFTGITISAPNGDVKIQGKNVSIEAGNNLTIKSGENIKNGFFGSNSLKSFDKTNIAKDVATAIVSKGISYIDLSFIRHTLEIVSRPIEGTLEIKSHRFLKLEAGPGEADIPISGYTLAKVRESQHGAEDDTPNRIIRTFEQISPIVEDIIDDFITKLNTCWNTMDAYARHLTNNAFTDADCISADDLLTKIATAPDTELTKDDFDFKGKLSIKEEDISQLAQTRIDNGLRVPLDNIKVLIRRSREAKQKKIIKLAEQWRTKVKEFKDFIDTPYIVAPDPQIDTDKLQAAIREVCSNDTEAGSDAIFNQIRNDFEGYLRDWEPILAVVDVINNIKGKHKRIIAKKLLTKYGTDIEQQAITDVNAEDLVPFQIPNVATENDAADKTQEWTDYVNSLKVKRFSFSGATKENNPLSDKFKDNVNIIKNLRDDKVWGDERRGQILFSSGNTTQVLGNDIHQAETFFSAHSSLHPDGEITGHSDELRTILNSL